MAPKNTTPTGKVRIYRRVEQIVGPASYIDTLIATFEAIGDASRYAHHLSQTDMADTVIKQGKNASLVPSQRRGACPECVRHYNWNDYMGSRRTATGTGAAQVRCDCGALIELDLGFPMGGHKARLVSHAPAPAL
jgi:hypothetical protein